MLRSDRIALVAVTLLILVVGTSVVVTASSNRPAGAACNGGTPALVNSYNGGGTLVAQESVTYPGTTCNGDGTYSGAVLDAATDGSCATAYYLEPLAYYAAREHPAPLAGGRRTRTATPSAPTACSSACARRTWRTSGGSRVATDRPAALATRAMQPEGDFDPP